jgi:hypothetical protein
MWFPLDGEIAHFNLPCGTKFLAYVRNRCSGHSEACLDPLSTAQHITPAVEYEVPPRDRAVRQVRGIRSVFGFVLSGPGLDGVADPVMKYRWL